MRVCAYSVLFLGRPKAQRDSNGVFGNVVCVCMWWGVVLEENDRNQLGSHVRANLQSSECTVGIVLSGGTNQGVRVTCSDRFANILGMAWRPDWARGACR